MEKYTETFADEIVQLCISKYDSLGKTGKPKNASEWTLLSCFVEEDQCSNTLQVVALGTGSKCVGRHQLPLNGDVLHDSHAEVIARRAFLLYLIDQMRKAANGHKSTFEKRDGTFHLKSGVFFHFYTSHTPCGDASIFPKNEWSESVGNILSTEAKKASRTSTPTSPEAEFQSDLKATTDMLDTEPAAKKRRRLEGGDVDGVPVVSSRSGGIDVKMAIEDPKEGFRDSPQIIVDAQIKENNGNECVSDTSSDIFRTGARCVVGEASDPHLPGSSYHVIGALRTKPGRGDPTLSLSCSDKIFKWTVLGIQGALPMILLTMPVYMTSIVIGQCPYSHEAMRRAIFDRFREGLKDINLPGKFSVHTPVLLQSKIDFPHSRTQVARNGSEDIKLMPTPTSIIWSDTDFHKGSQQEVATNGRRLGCTKKNFGTLKSRVSICRKSVSSLLLDFVKETGWKQTDLNQMSYRDLKSYSNIYLQAWNTLKTKCLSNWTIKPKHLKDFILT